MRTRRLPVLVLLIALSQLLVGAALICFAAGNLITYYSGVSRETVTIRKGNQTTTQEYDTNEEMEREVPGSPAILLGTSAFGMALGAAAFVGAIGMIRMRKWGWWLTFLWALADAPYRLVTVVVWWTVLRPAANKIVEMVPRDEGGKCGTLVNHNTFFHVGWGLFDACFFFYVALVLLLIVLPPVRGPLLGAAEQADDSEEEEDERPRRRRDKEGDRPRRPGRNRRREEDD
jgi:hypothetical protein